MIQDEDLDLLLGELYHRYGYDFTNYAKASLKRRVDRLLILERFTSFAELLDKVKMSRGTFLR